MPILQRLLNFLDIPIPESQVWETLDDEQRIGVSPRFIIPQTLHGCRELLGVGPLDNLLYLLRS